MAAKKRKIKNRAAKRRKDPFETRMEFFQTSKGALQILAVCALLALFIGPTHLFTGEYAKLEAVFANEAGGVTSHAAEYLEEKTAAAEELLPVAKRCLTGGEAAALETAKSAFSEASGLKAVTEADAALNDALRAVFKALEGQTLSSGDQSAVAAANGKLTALGEKIAADPYAEFAAAYNEKKHRSFLGNLSSTPEAPLFEW